MAQKKVVLDYRARAIAHQAASQLQELFYPAPDAVTVFEQPDALGDTDEPVQWRVEAYFSTIEDEAGLLTDLKACLENTHGVARFEAIPDLNWVALSQAALPPVMAGRFTIYGSHDRHRITDGPNSILIDAGEAFGTAHHATTLGCLTAIDCLSRQHTVHRALDLGCGSAVLSIALARTQPAARIIASDRDAQSIVVAQDNIRQNRARRQVTALVANGLNHPALHHAFDFVIANILAGPLLHLAPDLSRVVKTCGLLTLSGILDRQAAEIQARYQSFGFALCSKFQLDGWTTLTFVKRAHRPSIYKPRY